MLIRYELKIETGHYTAKIDDINTYSSRKELTGNDGLHFKCKGNVCRNEC